MPFKSKAQQRKIAELEKQGKVKPGTTEAWAKETTNLRSLPERVGKAKPKSLEDLRKLAARKK